MSTERENHERAWQERRASETRAMMASASADKPLLRLLSHLAAIAKSSAPAIDQMLMMPITVPAARALHDDLVMNRPVLFERRTLYAVRAEYDGPGYKNPGDAPVSVLCGIFLSRAGAEECERRVEADNTDNGLERWDGENPDTWEYSLEIEEIEVQP